MASTFPNSHVLLGKIRALLLFCAYLYSVNLVRGLISIFLNNRMCLCIGPTDFQREFSELFANNLRSLLDASSSLFLLEPLLTPSRF